MSMEQEKLLKFIYEVSFAMFDTVLFLDTHPNNRDALQYYENYRKLKKQAVQEYTKSYGPLTSDDVTENNHWTWIDDPWPWEGVL